MNIRFQLLLILSVLLTSCNWIIQNDNRIQPWAENPWYWQYHGNPIMLFGASNDDNLFQWPPGMLIPHLDSMQDIGANYVRNTMSDRVYRGFEIYPFRKTADGKYDLNQWNETYWERFEAFLKETARRRIIVQIEIWDRFDYTREYWLSHPYNPRNNINYTHEESGLASLYPDHPGSNKQPFFFTTPQQRNNEVLLNYQNRQVEKMLSYAIKFDHVLFCIDNETSAEESWAVYWSEFIKGIANQKGKEICITEMWDNWNLTTNHHKRTFDHPERYAFCDVSQNNQKKGSVHWDNFQWVREYISKSPRPLNTVKTYGADGGRHGNTKDGLERWWRHVLGGAASARFHRPPSGLGLSTYSINSVKIAREVEDIIPFWELTEKLKVKNLAGNSQIYLASKPGEAWVCFFENGGQAELDLSNYPGQYTIEYWNIRTGKKQKTPTVKGGVIAHLEAPGKLEWIAIVHKD